MGRLRTAVHNFADLDLPPDELLGHLDDLVTRIDQDERRATARPRHRRHLPVRHLRPGHPAAAPWRAPATPAPRSCGPTAPSSSPTCPRGPPLGLGGLPFETAELELPEGSRLVLYTDGLVEDRDRDIDDGLDLLRATLADRPARTPGGDLRRPCSSALLPDRPSDDIALLVARTQALDAGAGRRVGRAGRPRRRRPRARRGGPPADRMGPGRSSAFTTELILSELVTNAIRYARRAHRACG